jgi:hypothetical protein
VSNTARGVIERSFAGHIGQKNFAITQAKYPHVLSLDADECLTPELRESIGAVKNDWRKDGYFLNRLSSFSGKWDPPWKLVP